MLFELGPHDGRVARCFELAAGLRETLEAQPGFLSIERFQSLARPGRYLSFSFWEDEDAVHGWRHQTPHRTAQREGRPKSSRTTACGWPTWCATRGCTTARRHLRTTAVR